MTCTLRIFLALLAHAALEADVVVALRKARLSMLGSTVCASRFAHRSSDRQRRDSDARSDCERAMRVQSQRRGR
jgi:hypothetical protein